MSRGSVTPEPLTKEFALDHVKHAIRSQGTFLEKHVGVSEKRGP